MESNHPHQNKSTNGMAIAGFVLAFFLPLLGLIFSIVSLSQISKNKQAGKGLAIAGIIISSILMVVYALFLLVIITFNGINTRGRDIERQTDIKAMHGQLEAYYAQNGYYPAFADMNSSSFRSVNLQGLTEDALIDPDGYTAKLVTSPQTSSYSYEVLPSNCDNLTKLSLCTSYTLTATLEGTIDGSYTYIKDSLNY